jgi:3'-phosphoadenosine 5'-phosphosulfate sulfotransferase (PAPS reductase)/FAD synthetase
VELVFALKNIIMQLSLLDVLDDTWKYQDKTVMIGLSGGINSAAVLVYLALFVEEKPDVLHLFYAHFDEHSPDTKRFVKELVKFAKKHFKKVVFVQENHSVNKFFEKSNMIPHPTNSACTGWLKIFPMRTYMAENGIDVDLVGYVRSEQATRIKRQKLKLEAEKKKKNPRFGKPVDKNYLIAHMSNADCFSLLEKNIKWKNKAGKWQHYPAIYDLKWTDKRIVPFLEEHKHLIPKKQYDTVLKYAVKGYNTKKHSYNVFDHNNCLPCKNMQSWQFYMVKLFYPLYFAKAMATAGIIEKNIEMDEDKENKTIHWGRDADELHEAGSEANCTFCAFD